MRRTQRKSDETRLGSIFTALVGATVFLAVAILFAANRSIVSENTHAGESNSTVNEKIDSDYTIVRVSEESVVRKYPHDPSAFTQGLVLVSSLDDTTKGTASTTTTTASTSIGRLFESTGLYGESTLREIDVGTGSVVRKIEMDASDFGEGLCEMVAPNERSGVLIQLTWKKRTGYVYDARTLETIRTFRYETTPPRHEGWGITGNGTHLFVSDGTATIFVWDANSFEEVDRFVVYESDPQRPKLTRPVSRINELEWVRSEILANVWYDDRIVRIDPIRRPGQILGEYDCAELARPHRKNNQHAVLNGIAYDESDDTLLITGKLWNAMYRIRRK